MVVRMSYLTKAKDAVGTTSGTEEKIDDLITPSDSVDFLGFVCIDANSGVVTAGEANQARFRAQLRTLANEDVYPPAPSSYGGAPGTNIEANVFCAHLGWNPFLPLNQNASAGFGNKKTTFFYEVTGPEPTADHAAQVSIVTVNGQLPPYVMDNVGRIASRYAWSESVQEDDIKATSTSFSAGITVPGWVSEIFAIKIQLALDAAPTANEHLLGYLSLGGTVPGVNGFVEVPMTTISGNLGTPVGGAVVDYGTVLPLYIDMKSITSDATINFTSNLLVALTGAVSCQVTLYGR